MFRLEDGRIPKQVIFCKLRDCKESVCKSCRWYKDGVKDSLKKNGIDSKMWEETTKARVVWKDEVMQKKKPSIKRF